MAGMRLPFYNGRKHCLCVSVSLSEIPLISILFLILRQCMGHQPGAGIALAVVAWIRSVLRAISMAIDPRALRDPGS